MRSTLIPAPDGTGERQRLPDGAAHLASEPTTRPGPVRHLDEATTVAEEVRMGIPVALPPVSSQPGDSRWQRLQSGIELRERWWAFCKALLGRPACLVPPLGAIDQGAALGIRSVATTEGQMFPVARPEPGESNPGAEHPPQRSEETPCSRS